MLPFGPSANPAQMKRMLSQMGIQSEELDALKVIIELHDKNLIVENPKVSLIKMQGIKTFNIVGDIKEASKEPSEPKELFSNEDVSLVMEKTNSGKKEAESALKKTNGDIAEAILLLSKKKE